ncbi:MAG TPA: hypothetical protein VMC06_02460 [Opitutaceae bacterium]|nr:hypothetical protein [Opitutaceae bacterium]
MKSRLVLAALLLVLAGCATTPADRIAQNQSTFDAWPAEVQAKVRAGQVGMGFTEDQVRIALGDPERVITRTTEHGIAMVWAYRHSKSHFSFGLGMAGGGGHTGYGAGVAVDDRPYFSGDAVHVVFMDHRVVSIETTRRQ